MKEWIENLKVGDYVFVSQRIGTSLGKVEKITPKGNIKVNGIMFNKNGLERGCDVWNKCYLNEATPEAIKSFREELTIKKAIKIMREIKSITIEQANKIIELLNHPTEKGGGGVMAEHIKRTDVMKICEGYSRHCFLSNDSNGQDIADRILDDVVEIPTADVVEVKRGEWILKSRIYKMFDDVDEEFFVECSICHRNEYVPFELTEEKMLEYAKENYPYCHCGAKMDGTPKERGGEM